MLTRIRDLLRWRRGLVKRALTLAGSGVVGGRYEAGVPAGSRIASEYSSVYHEVPEDR
jgi:hypothetical protein